MADDIIMVEEGALYALLRKHIGHRVRISSRSVQHLNWITLTKVTEGAGRIWCYDDAGAAWLVEPEGFTMDVEPIIGSWDMDAAAVQMKAIHDTREIYGPSPKEMRDRCPCSTCMAKYERGDAEHEHWVGEQLKMLDTEEAPTIAPPEIIEDDRPSSDTFEGF